MILPRLHKTAPVIMWILFIILLPCALISTLTNSTVLIEWPLLLSIATPINITLICDPFGLLFSGAVLLISANVLQFSTIYIKNDKFLDRFTKLVILFVLSINFLIYLPSFIALLLGWDGLGITSFILVIYYQNPKSLAAGLITAITNRIGDVILLMAIGLTVNQAHWNVIHIRTTRHFSTLQILAILIAAMTKSAQMPFSSWLPAAIAAPTPVSALVHSSTLVTAGVFLAIRFYPFLSLLPLFNKILLFTAVSTMLIAGLRATTEHDIKKIIALSTLRQLGIIITSLAFGLVSLTFFHILTHAIFKSLLFVCAGSFINTHIHRQDLRWMGNLTSQFPVATSCLLISNSALCGLPFIAGYYSKDLIIEAALFNTYNTIIVLLSLLAVGLTAFYSIRFSINVIWGPVNHSPFASINENINIIAPILVLSSVSIIGGASFQWLLPITTSSYFLPPHLKWLTLSVVVIGLIFGWGLRKICITLITPLHQIHLFGSCIIWFLIPLSSQFILPAPLVLGHHYLKSMDHGWTELSSSQGINTLAMKSNWSITNINPLTPTAYILGTSVSCVFILTLWAIIS